jgi:RNA polymerase sigma factor (sigma-70 family)
LITALQSKIEEQQLISLLYRQDKDAFSYLYDNYSAALFGVILRIVIKEETAEDVLQETFVKIWSNFESYDKTKGKLFTWMVNVARNLAIDKTRSKNFQNEKKNFSSEKNVDYIDSHKSTEFKPDNIGIRELLNKLPTDQQQLIDMAYFQGYTQQELADVLQMPLGTVKTKMRAAIMTLRKLIGKE